MATARSASSSNSTLHCDHCGRPVKETCHTRNSYRVDYYSMHTGDVEPIVIKAEEDAQPLTFQKLRNAVEVVTCVDCYRDPDVQRERERRFRPELAGGGQA